MSIIPDAFHDLLDRPIIVTIATIMPDGSAQVHPVWADRVGNQVRFNTVVGRQKYLNLKHRKHATILIVDPENPMRWMEIRGELAAMEEESGIGVIDKLSRDYTGVFPYPSHNDQDTRVTCLISPTHVLTNNG